MPMDMGLMQQRLIEKAFLSYFRKEKESAFLTELRILGAFQDLQNYNDVKYKKWLNTVTYLDVLSAPKTESASTLLLSRPLPRPV